MPKYEYHRLYGALAMPSFVLSWLSLLVMPILVCAKSKRTLVLVNQVCFVISYMPIFLVCLVFFMIGNLVMLPFAYLKTIVHKAALMHHYKSINYCRGLLFFIVFGVPLLAATQISDIYHFTRHSFYLNQRLRTMKKGMDTVPRTTFEDFLTEVK